MLGIARLYTVYANLLISISTTKAQKLVLDNTGKPIGQVL
jgi:hypothetical protein